MVSLAYLITILLAFAAISHAKDVVNKHPDQVDSKWLIRGWNTFVGLGFRAESFSSGLNMVIMNPWVTQWVGGFNGRCFGIGMLGRLNTNILFTKATDDQSLSRRAIALDADQLYRRAAEEAHTCINQEGASRIFFKSDCLKAANQLAEKKVSTASHGSCALSLVSAKERVAPNQIHPSVLQKAAEELLKGCSTPSNAKQTTTAATSTESHDKQIAMLLFPGAAY